MVFAWQIGDSYTQVTPSFQDMPFLIFQRQKIYFHFNTPPKEKKKEEEEAAAAAIMATSKRTGT